MRYYTHLAFGFLAALLITPFLTINNIILFFFITLLGSLLPDIDHPNSKISNKIPILPKILSIFIKHRGIFHTIFLAILIPGLVWLFIGHIYGIALFIGYTSHLIIDGFTKQGVNFLHPIAKLHISGFIETGTYAEIAVLIGIIALIVIKLI